MKAFHFSGGHVNKVAAVKYDQKPWKAVWKKFQGVTDETESECIHDAQEHCSTADINL